MPLWNQKPSLHCYFRESFHLDKCAEVNQWEWRPLHAEVKLGNEGKFTERLSKRNQWPQGHKPVNLPPQQ